MAHRPNRDLATAPVSHQKRPHQNATNAIERTQNRSKINETVRCTAAHNGSGCRFECCPNQQRNQYLVRVLFAVAVDSRPKYRGSAFIVRAGCVHRP
jgi:hypothetical protein